MTNNPEHLSSEVVTDAMIEAGQQAHLDHSPDWQAGVDFKAIYLAMTASRPVDGPLEGGAIKLDVGGLIERMDNQVEEWDADEPRDDWWNYQSDFLEARNFLVIVNEGPPLLALSATAPNRPACGDGLGEQVERVARALLQRRIDITDETQVCYRKADSWKLFEADALAAIEAYPLPDRRNK